MRIDWTGKIEENFYALGHPSVPVYLLDGPRPALFDAGFTGLAAVYIEEIKKVLGKRSPSFLFLTHAHWDHIGSAGIFKKVWPGMVIAASPETAKILSRPRVVDTIISLNRDALDALHHWGVSNIHCDPFIPFGVERIISPRNPISLDFHTSVIGIPSQGHTRDFTVYWIPEKKVLIASEAVGCDDIPEFIVDYDNYVKGIKAFMNLDIHVLCTGHQLVVTGRDVKRYLKRARETAENFRRCVEKQLRKGETVDGIADYVKQKEWDRRPLPKQPLLAYVMNTKGRIRTLKKRWDGESTP